MRVIFLILDFETLWPELESWNILTKQYEDCIIINTALCKASREKVSRLIL